MGEAVDIRREAGVKALNQIVMRQIAVLPPPDDADLIREAAVKKVVGFPNAGDNDACADAYWFGTAAAGHDDEILVILDEPDL